MLVALWITIHKRQIMLMDWLLSALKRRNSSKGQQCHSFSSQLGPHRPFNSVAQSCPTLHDPMDCRTPGPLVHHQLQEFTQTHPHWVGDAIQPSHPLSSPSPPALSLSQTRVFSMSQSVRSGGQSIGVSASTSVLPMNTQDWSPLGWTGWISVQGTLKSLL